jgi:hypothetical protein
MNVPARVRNVLRQVAKTFNRFACRRRQAVLAVGLLGFLSSAAISNFVHWPQPFIHDEFSYLLTADTFAHGRLTNPTHPLWEHFESFHIIQRPTYASKYPPGQGLLLALGIVLFGHALAGVWLGIGLACGGVCWMLQGWLPPRWALLGALIATLQMVIATDDWVSHSWSQCYWGGGAAAFGGALMLGGFRRVFDSLKTGVPRFGAGLALGLGLAVLAYTRPFEGLVCSVPAGLLILTRLFQRASRVGGWSSPIQVVLSVSLVLVPALAWLAYYNHEVTGSWHRMPYVVHEREYGMSPIFLFQEPLPVPSFRHDVMRDYTIMQFTNYQSQRPLDGRVYMVGKKLALCSDFYLGPFLLAPLLVVPWLWRRPWLLFILVNLALGLSLSAIQIAFYPHYFAPFTALVYLLLVQAIRRIHLVRIGANQVGRLAVRMILVAQALWMIGSVFTEVKFRPGPERERVELQADLMKRDRPSLVIVRYPPGYVSPMEWVYNEADIDHAWVVWAREMKDEAKNAELREYFKDREIHVITVKRE